MTFTILWLSLCVRGKQQTSNIISGSCARNLENWNLFVFCWDKKKCPSPDACTLKWCDGLRASITPRATSVGVSHSWQVQPSWTGLWGSGQTRVCTHADPRSRKMRAFWAGCKSCIWALRQTWLLCILEIVMVLSLWIARWRRRSAPSPKGAQFQRLASLTLNT